MREIKFRAWDKRRNIYGEVLELHRPRKDGDSSFPDGHKGRVSLFNIKNEHDCGFWGSWIEFVDLEQFAGLRDKNGKEIYEGDIIQVHHVRLVSDGPVHKPRVAEIKWLDDDCGFRLVGAEVRSTNPDIYPTSHLEIIGNIHETHELLKGANT